MIPDVQDGTISEPQQAMASVFANPDDLRRYQEAIANGATEKEALSVGDQGKGAWGDDTTSTTDPQVAVKGAPHNALIQVTGPKGTVIARNTDKINSDRIDLNPATALAVGHPGGVIPVQWSFVNGTAPSVPNTNLGSSSPISLMPSRGAASAIPEINLLDMANEDLSQGQPLMADENAPESGVFATDSITGEPLVPASSDQNNESDNGAGTQDSTRTVHINDKVLQTMQPPAPGSPGTTYDPATKTVSWPGPGGITLHRDDYGNVSYTQPQPKKYQQVKGGGKVFEIDPDTGKSRDVTPEGYVEPLHDSIMKQLADRQISPVKQDGSQMTPTEAMQAVTQYDKDAGKLTPYQQHEVDKVTQQANSSRSMYSSQYVKMQPNYVSIYDNVTGKPLRQRNGVDDAFLISAASGLENPGRASSGHDFALLQKSAGPSGQIEIMGQRIKGTYGALIDSVLSGDPEAQKELEGTRILSDAQVTQILDNSKRAIKPRQAEYEVGQKPFRQRLQNANVNPDDYLPNLALPDENASASPTPSATPSIQDNVRAAATRILADPNATLGAKAKAQRALDKLGP